MHAIRLPTRYRVRALRTAIEAVGIALTFGNISLAAVKVARCITGHLVDTALLLGYQDKRNALDVWCPDLPEYRAVRLTERPTLRHVPGASSVLHASVLLGGSCPLCCIVVVSV